MKAVRYKCGACGAFAARDQLVRGAWGDYCCPHCSSPNLERLRGRWETLYGIFFLYKVY
jgi:hypothetical protein